MWGLAPKARLQDRYQFIGFISSGTYGRVYKAIGIDGEGVFAIKKFKPERENEALYVGISQSAVREMSLCAELKHPNVIRHVETILQDRSIYMVFEYCEHDLLQIIHYHSQLQNNASTAATRQYPQQHLHPNSARGSAVSTPTIHSPSTSSSSPPCHPWAISPHTIRSILYQLLLGTDHLHSSYVQHRDLKPANIMLSSPGKLSIGDLGLARIFLSPAHPLYSGDKVVVTIWYRAPELLLGSRHYTTAVDMWAVGCIFAELLGLRPIFKGEEAKMERKSVVPWQKSQMGKILEVFGTNGFEDGWREDLKVYPEWNNYSALTLSTQGGKYRSVAGGAGGFAGLKMWYVNALATGGYDTSPATSPGAAGFDLLCGLLRPNPTTRISAKDALAHPYFRDITEAQKQSCLDADGTSNGVRWPKRKITQEDGEGGKILLPQKRGIGAIDEAASATGTGPGRLGGAVGGVGSGVMSHGLLAGQAMTTGAAGRAPKRLKEG